jgi:hypothetical protein
VGAQGACGLAVPSFAPPPEDARANAERQAAEFGVEIREYHGVLRVPRRVFQRLLPERPTPERCVEDFFVAQTRRIRRSWLHKDAEIRQYWR